MLPQHGLMSGAMSAPRIRTGETLGRQSGARELNYSATGRAPYVWFFWGITIPFSTATVPFYSKTCFKIPCWIYLSSYFWQLLKLEAYHPCNPTFSKWCWSVCFTEKILWDLSSITFSFSLSCEEEKSILQPETHPPPVLRSPPTSPSSAVLNNPLHFPLSLEPSVFTSGCPFPLPTAMPRHYQNSTSAFGILLCHHASLSLSHPMRGSLCLLPVPLALFSGLCHVITVCLPHKTHLRCGISKPDLVTFFHCLLFPLVTSAVIAWATGFVQGPSVTLAEIIAESHLTLLLTPSVLYLPFLVSWLYFSVFLKLTSCDGFLFLRKLWCSPAAWRNGSDSGFCHSEIFIVNPASCPSC